MLEGNRKRWLGRSSLASHAALAALAALVVLLALPDESRAGGQGQGLPEPPFIDAFDATVVFGAMNTSQVGAPAPRWVRLDALATACSDPRLEVPVAFGPLTVVDGLGSTDVCIPDFVAGASLPGKVRVTRKQSDVTIGGTPGAADEVVRSDVEMTLTLSVVLASGEVQIQSLVVPPSSFTKQPFNNTFSTPPPLVQEVGWFDGEPLCSGRLALDFSQRITVERIAAGRSETGSFASIGVNGLNREALVAVGQQALPTLLCQPDAAGDCTFTPSVVFVETDGTLSEPTNETVAGDTAECDVTIRFAQPAIAAPDACEADLAVCEEDLAICLADPDPPCADSDGDGESDATDRCAATPPGEAVDDAGCSLAEFCGQFDTSRPKGRWSCRRGDWGNDEPSVWQHDRDCRVVRNAQTTLSRCVPAP